MKHARLALLAFASALSMTPAAFAAEWKPADGPLMTRWAKDVSPDRVHPEYPRPQMVRKDWVNLNGLWQLAFAKEGEAAPTGQDLPEQILVPFPVESALSGVMKRADRLWYRRLFDAPPADGQRWLLHFGAVDWEATVYVNGQKLTVHRGGYDGFTVDVTDALKPSGPNELIVGVYDPTDAGTQARGKQVRKPGGIFYTPTTGIWQTVWLEPVPTAHIRHLRITPHLEQQEVRIRVGGERAKGAQVKISVLDGDQEVNTGSGSVGEEIAVKVPDAKLWSPEHPFLYGLKIELAREAGGKATDEVESYFGMRSIKVAKDDAGVPRLMLNGEFVFQVGPLDQGFWPDGLYTAPTDEALRYDIEVTKELGFNMTRKHVKTEPARWYYWCDKLGLLVWQDMPAGDKGVAPGKGEITRTAESARQFEKELEQMIAGLRNHPSIVMWVVFNEGWGQYDTVRLTNHVKQLDPSRLANCASGWNDYPAGDVIDMHSYPGPSAPKGDGNRAVVLGEFGGLSLNVKEHTWSDETWGYAGTKTGEELTARYQSLLRRGWDLKDSAGLNAVVYTQITDVETEANGLLTYDRAVIKVNVDQTKVANQGKLPPLKVVVPTSEHQPQTWRYTFEKPAADWFEPSFDAGSWKEGPGGFGTQTTPGSVVRTEWSTPEIWLRREVTIDDLGQAPLLFLVHHDEDVTIYVNGVLAAKAEGYTTGYGELHAKREGQAAFRQGKNVIAVHCKQSGGGQYIDVGVVQQELQISAR